ncbi:hypothetical protein E8P82_11345 [Arthrobacter echini]|uniref:HdeD family acid-resistance protein n=1 Tax=Arthrobacter echini TaxID=1529066 RepID=A0A4S5E369_9MICC|nr:DUF308 domain-containing protein [Arthrobacter echini]THJ65864.1 hypothetical protein E8P82_11345 [Arthrobacter echini]
MQDNTIEGPVKAVGNAMLGRGVVALIFGILVLVWPQATVVVLVLLFGSYAIIDGITAGVHWFSARRGPVAYRSSGWVLAGGIVSVLAGLVALLVPGLTALAIALVIGIWALLLGITQVILALAGRKAVSLWWVGLVSGILAIIFGLLLLIFPGAGILGLLGFLGVFGITLGILFIVSGFQIRSSTGRA